MTASQAAKYKVLFSGENLVKLLKSTELQVNGRAIRYEAERGLQMGEARMWEKWD